MELTSFMNCLSSGSARESLLPVSTAATFLRIDSPSLKRMKTSAPVLEQRSGDRRHGPVLEVGGDATGAWVVPVPEEVADAALEADAREDI